MTSFIIRDHIDRPPSLSWKHDTGCSFCRIVSGELPASRVYEDELVIAILDILPLRPGHTLVIPKAHYSRLSELPVEYAAAVGTAVSKVAKALTLAMDNTGLNVVCNQEYAQAVPHVHYHIIPAPILGGAVQVPAKGNPPFPLTRREMHQAEFEGREELEDDEAVVLKEKIRSKL